MVIKLSDKIASDIGQMFIDKIDIELKKKMPEKYDFKYLRSNADNLVLFEESMN